MGFLLCNSACVGEFSAAASGDVVVPNQARTAALGVAAAAAPRDLSDNHGCSTRTLTSWTHTCSAARVQRLVLVGPRPAGRGSTVSSSGELIPSSMRGAGLL
ncbi:hypothetical protein AURDEDRAFT_110493 [Auricularia subglabra TFB-10046 SS5]|nr:hypothetical protein AURDEDRAFT_110493 [Auricularia subglabra TFB-10046 SS5]